MSFSDYIVYVDESGDHSLVSIDENYPIFVLVFVIFKKEDYIELVKDFKNFKFKHFGYDTVILHENEIRREKGPFKFLKTKEKKELFLYELTKIIDKTKCTVLSSIIDKNHLIKKYASPTNPYNLSLKFLLERLYLFLQENNQTDKTTHIIVEARGRKEDEELKNEFQNIINKDNFLNKVLPFELIIAHKQINSDGMQLADLMARPIGRKYLKPEQTNQAFEIIKNKFREVNGKYKNYGIKIFP